MNLFNELLKSGQSTMSNMIKNNIGYGNSDTKDQKLRGQLHTCTYSDEQFSLKHSKKFFIEKSVKQVFHVYPNFDTDVLSFKQGNVQKRFIELKAILEIEVRGKICKVDYNMMIPANFPQKPPYVRIINRNPEFIVDDFYKPLQSPSDQKSYILNERLNQIKHWDPSKSIINVVIECYDLLRNKFPFSKSNYPSTMPNQGPKSPWQQQFNMNYQQGNNYNQGGFSGWNQNSMQGFNNPNYNMAQLAPNYGFNTNNKPPLNFNPSNINQIIANGQKFAGESKQKLQKLKTQHVRGLETVQSLDILRYSIQSEENFLRKQNIQMNNFLANQNNESTQSLLNLVKPQDELSQQILDLLAGIKAREDCATEVESKFNEGSITLDDFLKHMRKNEQVKFEEKVLLAKCVSVSQKY